MERICLALACTYKSKSHWQPIKWAVNDSGRMKEQGSCPLQSKVLENGNLRWLPVPSSLFSACSHSLQVFFQSYAELLELQELQRPTELEGCRPIR